MSIYIAFAISLSLFMVIGCVVALCGFPTIGYFIVAISALRSLPHCWKKKLADPIVPPLDFPEEKK